VAPPFCLPPLSFTTKSSSICRLSSLAMMRRAVPCCSGAT
jgi:hypothetical protein